MIHLLVSFIILSILLLCVNLLIPSFIQKKLKWLSFAGAMLAAGLGLLTYFTYNIWLAIVVLVILMSLTVFYLRQQLLTMQFDTIDGTSVDDDKEEEQPLIELTEETREELEEIVSSEVKQDSEVGLSFDDSDMNQEAIDEQVASMLEEQEKEEHLYNEELVHEGEIESLTNSNETDKVKDELKSTEHTVEEVLEIEVEKDLLQDRSHLENIPEEIDDEEALLASRKWLIDDMKVEDVPLQVDIAQTAISQLDEDFYKKLQEPIELTDKINDLSNLDDRNEEQAPKNKKIILEDLNLKDSN